MDIVVLLLLVAAFVIFLLAAANFPSRVNLVAVGLALWVLSVILMNPTLGIG